MNPTLIILIVLGVVVLWVVLTYNRLIALRNRVKEAFSDIDVQLKRRYNLIPNLIETVKGYANHEKEVFQKVTEARTRAMGASGVHERAEAENMLTGALKTLFAVSENYPNLQAAENFVELQRELRDTEDKIQAARRFYNNTVMSMNNKVETVPSNMIAGMFKFQKEEFFELQEEAERELPKVKF